MMVKAFNHVLVSTSDLSRTVEFYENVLGLEAFQPPDTGRAFNMRWYRSRDGVEVHVVEKNPNAAFPGSSFNPTMQPHMGFEVDGLDDAKEMLLRSGTDVYEPAGTGVLSRKQVLFRDPSGLVVELFEDNA
jgi:catechol 2,3-dioxygenase-like lactoylglutathione lyase family enzyme